MKKTIVSIIFILISFSNVYSQWVEKTSPSIFTLFSISPVDEDLVWTCASGNNIFRSTDGGSSWVNVGLSLPPPAGVMTCIYALDVNTAFVTLYAGNPNNAYVYKTTNGGQNWNLIFIQSPGFITAINMKNANNGFMVGWPQGGRWSLWKTSNGGTNWDSTGLYIPETDQNVWSFENCLVYQGSNLWFGARGKGVYYSTNDGGSWSLQNLSGAGFCYPSYIWFEDLTNGFTSAQLNLVKTTNSGANWLAVPGSNVASEVVRGIVSFNMTNIWQVRDITPNIYYSSNGGANWVIQHTSPSNTGYKQLTKSRNNDILWAITIGGEVERNDNPTSISTISSEVPSKFMLFQNYPNPFNPTTNIKFNVAQHTPYPLSRGETVTLKVYDIMGREIQTLVDKRLQPGTYETSFDGSSLTSGVYFYKLIADGFSETKKMVLIK
jgi:photosystem II stability/assembly factor-like uncharacterized protein